MSTELLPVLEKHEVEQLLQQPSKRYSTGIRNRAILHLMVYCGLRVSEIVGHEKRDGGGLRIHDIDFNTGKLSIRDAKDTRSQKSKSKKVKSGRIVYANQETLEKLRDWWDIRSGFESAIDHFFTTLESTKVQPRYIRSMMKRYGEKIGLREDQLHPHILRHTFGTEFYRAHKDLRLTQQVMGHRSSKTTEIYAHISGAEVENAMKNFMI